MVLLLAAVIALFAARLSTPHTFTGDEPHYLLMTGSLISDHDLDVKNDYLLQRYLAYYPGPIGQHVNFHLFTNVSPHWYEDHEPGLSILLVPLVALDGPIGAVIAMVLVACATLLLAYLWTTHCVEDRLAGVIAAGCLLVSPFFLGLNGYIYPDMLIAGMITAALLLEETWRGSYVRLILLGLILGLATWVHVKVSLMFGSVGLLMLARILLSRGSPAGRLASVAALSLPWLGLILFFEVKLHEWYGSWIPTVVYKGLPGQLGTVSLGVSMPSVLFDSAVGLFVNNPLWIAAAGGFGVWLARRPAQALRVLLVTVPSFLIFHTYSNYLGWSAPTGRFLVEFMPVYAAAFGWLARPGAHLVWRLLLLVLAVIQGGITALSARLQFPWLEDLHNPWIELLHRRFGIPRPDWFPTFSGQPVTPFDYAYLATFVALLAALMALGLVSAIRGQRRLSGEPPLPS